MTHVAPPLDPSDYGGAKLPPKHLEVLRTAMRLIAERGYRGASLRELARRVGMQQPSLYHYFRSKEDMVEQILVSFGFGGIGSMPTEGRLPERFEDVPALLASIVTWLYGRTDWPHFVRFVFNLAIEAPKYQPRLRAMLVEETAANVRMLTRAYVEAGQVPAQDAEHLTRLVVNAIGLPLIEEHLLFPSAGDHPDLDAYVAFVVRFASEGVKRGALGAKGSPALPRVGSKIAEGPRAKPRKRRAPSV